MILSAHAITKALESGDWTCSIPLDTLNLGINSVDVTLFNEILTPAFTGSVNPRKVPERELFKSLVFTNYILEPQNFILASVNEAFDCTRPLFIHGRNRFFVPNYEGRSTMARLGLASHLSAAFGDWGFSGSFTLEMYNHAPWALEIEPGMRIGQVFFLEVDEDVHRKRYKGYSQTDLRPHAPILGPDRA